MKKYQKYIKPYWIYFVLSPILMIVEVFCDVKIPALSTEIINIGVANLDSDQIILISCKMLFYVILAVSTGVGASYCATQASVNFAADLRSDVFKKIQNFSFANIDKFSTGSLVTRLTNDITQMQQMVVMCLRMMFRAPGMLIGAIIMSYMLSPGLSFIFILLVPVLALIIFLILMFSYKKFGLLQTKVDALNSNVQEILTNVRVIKALTREDYETNRFLGINSDLRQTGVRAYRITILQMPLMTIAVNFSTIAVLWFGSIALNQGTLEVGNISALITYLTQILASVNMIAMIFLQSSRAIVSSKRITDVLETEIDITNKVSDNLNKTVNSGDIRFENVNFKYYKNNHEWVLSDISVDIKSGQTVGVIGSTGCGKTSFVNLIPRLYDVDSGAIFVDGIDVRDYDLTHLREGVAVVLQNNLLFSGTIAENLRWGDKNASIDDLNTVADWSASQEFIKTKSEGYETFVDQGGVNLSGGQKQRLCIARALLKKPKILILDDSTSAVDTATEGKISHHLNHELKDTTKIIIAQRITSVMNADVIIVMNDGKIEQIGKHQDLLETCKTYQEICSSQIDKEVQA